MGGEDVLLIPRRRQPLPDYGVLARRGHDDPPHEEGYVVGRVHAGIDQSSHVKEILNISGSYIIPNKVFCRISILQTSGCQRLVVCDT